MSVVVMASSRLVHRRSLTGERGGTGERWERQPTVEVWIAGRCFVSDSSSDEQARADVLTVLRDLGLGVSTPVRDGT